MSPRRSAFDLAAAIRWEENNRRAYEAQFAASQAMAVAQHSMPARLSQPVELGTTPERLAEEIAASRRPTEEGGAKIAPRPAIAVLMGRREYRKIRHMPESREHLECWPGGEETFAGVAIVIRRGAGPPRVFCDIEELDAAVRWLPQPMLPPNNRRGG